MTAPATELPEEELANLIRLHTDFAGNDFRDAMRLARAIEVRALAAAPSDDSELRWCVGKEVFGRPTPVDAMEWAEKEIKRLGRSLNLEIDSRLPLPLVAALAAATTEPKINPSGHSVESSSGSLPLKD